MEETTSIGSTASEVGDDSVDNSNQGSTDGLMDFNYDFKSKRKSEADILAAQAQCYKRLSDLLEKSTKYTAMLCDRMERDNSSFAMLLKAKSELVMKKVPANRSRATPEVRKRGRPPKRKRDEIDQVVPGQEGSTFGTAMLESVVTDTSENLASSNSSQVGELPGASLGKEEKQNEEQNLVYAQSFLITGGKLRKYQLEGVSWLMKLYLNGVNGILADEMGLGKTIQCISLIADLICIGATGPFFICGPLSTILNWTNEFKKFAPSVPCIMYYGNKDERMFLYSSIIKAVTIAGLNQSCKPVVVTSYEVAINDRKYLGRIKWDLLIVDEGHRIKNSNCRLIRELKSYEASHRLLLTGTPLQNNLSELWTLLNFLIPEIFNSSGSFETWFDVSFLENVDDAGEQIVMEEEKSSTLSKIHQILTPFMLRRLKSDVDIIIPPKKELLVFAPFAPDQKVLYKSILDKTVSQMLGGGLEKVDTCGHMEFAKKRERKSVNYSLSFDDGGNEDDENSLTAWAEAVVKERQEPSLKENDNFWKTQQPVNVKNMLSLLRKCCNHPYLLQSKEGDFEITEDFVLASGKLHLMDRMLSKLKSQKHRVLIFSQSTQLLDLLEDYCIFRNYSFCRLDGKMTFIERQDQIEKFSKENVFLFLLSTRAGGLGINLTKADTVIIYDSDWNPQCDLQAQDRCHRIGQSQPVVIYRLVTGGSVDQKIVERATAKRKLEKIIIHKDKFKAVGSNTSHLSQSKVVDPQELLNILKETDYQDVIKDVGMSEAELDKLLDRSDLQKLWNERLSGKVQNPEGDEKISNQYFKVIEDVDD